MGAARMTGGVCARRRMAGRTQVVPAPLDGPVVD